MKLRHAVPILFVVILLLAAAGSALAHCQIPCGIYNDAARFDMLNEDITTIEKAMTQMKELAAADTINYNQLIRWTDNKEKHADKFMSVIWEYFLTQRIQPVDSTAGEQYKDYLKKLELIHHMTYYAMKCKQTTDTANTDKLGSLVEEFRRLYFKEHGHEH